MSNHDDGGSVEWFLKVLVGDEGTNGWKLRLRDWK